MERQVRTLRRAERSPLVLPAKCRSRTGFLDRVVITDLSPHGCRIESRALTVHEGDLVVLRPEGMEGLGGVVRWMKGHLAGVEFETPLYGPVVDHLLRIHAGFLTPSPAPASAARRMAA